MLVHSQAAAPDAATLRMVRRHACWVYVTDGVFRPGDPGAANPWDRLSAHWEAVCRQLGTD